MGSNQYTLCFFFYFLCDVCCMEKDIKHTCRILQSEQRWSYNVPKTRSRIFSFLCEHVFLRMCWRPAFHVTHRHDFRGSYLMSRSFTVHVLQSKTNTHTYTQTQPKCVHTCSNTDKLSCKRIYVCLHVPDLKKKNTL